MGVRDTARTVRDHIGRRGAFLAFLALLDVTIGYTLVQPPPAGLNVKAIYQPFVNIMPLAAWSWAWVFTGLVCAAGVFTTPVRPYAFAAGALIKTGWAFGYLTGWWVGLAFYSRGYQSAVIFTAFAAVCLIVAGWRENGQ